MKVLSFLASSISNIKIADIFDFLPVRYFGKGLLFLKFWLIGVNYCWNYGSLKLLFRFFCFRLGHLNNRQTKIRENSTTYFLKVNIKTSVWWKFQVPLPTTTDWRSFKFFAQLNGNHIWMASFSKFRKYQTFWFNWIG